MAQARGFRRTSPHPWNYKNIAPAKVPYIIKSLPTTCKIQVLVLSFEEVYSEYWGRKGRGWTPLGTEMLRTWVKEYGLKRSENTVYVGLYCWLLLMDNFFASTWGWLKTLQIMGLWVAFLNTSEFCANFEGVARNFFSLNMQIGVLISWKCNGSGINDRFISSPSREVCLNRVTGNSRKNTKGTKTNGPLNCTPLIMKPMKNQDYSRLRLKLEGTQYLEVWWMKLDRTLCSCGENHQVILSSAESWPQSTDWFKSCHVELSSFPWWHHACFHIMVSLWPLTYEAMILEGCQGY